MASRARSLGVLLPPGLDTLLFTVPAGEVWLTYTIGVVAVITGSGAAPTVQLFEGLPALEHEFDSFTLQAAGLVVVRSVRHAFGPLTTAFGRNPSLTRACWLKMSYAALTL